MKMETLKMKIFLVFFVAFCLNVAIGQHLKGVLNDDGSLNEDYEFVHGKYFLKENAKQDKLSAMSASALTYSQCNDHFSNPKCTSTWQQRYWQNDDYYKDGGPIFYYIGAEGPLDGCADDFGNQYLWYGAPLGAKFVCIEHRFYGNSYPTSDQSADGLSTLSSKQALEDYIQFLRWFKAGEGIPNAKVVVFGGSYGGNLAAWIREKYPQDINVAVSSSGPLNATFDMFQYVEVISKVINSINPDCYNALANVFKCMQSVVSGNSGCSPSVTSASQLPNSVNYCYDVDFTDTQSREAFWNNIAFIWASNYPNQQNTPMCQKLLTSYNANSGDPIAAYGQFLKANGNTWGSCGARQTSRRKISSMSAATDMTSWIWQTCTEFGYYQSADPTYSLFGANTWSADIWAANCRNTWGDSFTDEVIQASITKSVAYYKGQGFDGTCTIFVNGLYDPWHSLSITDPSKTSAKNSVVVIPTGEHCADMGHSKANAQDIITAQTQIQNLIQQYLNDATC